MRGGFTLNEMFNTSLKERKIISEIVEDNLKKEIKLKYMQ